SEIFSNLPDLHSFPTRRSSDLSLSWVGHVLGLDEGVEFFGGDITEFDGGFAEADLGVVGGFGDLGGVVVADFWSQGCDQHQRMIDRKSTRLNSSHVSISYAVFC